MTNVCGICFKVRRTPMPEHIINQVPALKHGKGNTHHSTSIGDEKICANLNQLAIFVEFPLTNIAKFDCLGQGKFNPLVTFFRMILILLKLRLAGTAHRMRFGAMSSHHRDAAYHQAEKPRRLDNNHHSLPWSSRS